MKSWRWAGCAVVVIEGIGSFVAMSLGQETVQLVLSCSACLILIAYCVAWLIMSRTY